MAKDMSRYRGMYEKGRRVVDLDTPTPEWVGIWNTERASQFMPFAALKGLDALMEQEGTCVEPQRGMNVERAALMDAVLASLGRGDRVILSEYVEGKGSQEVTGVVTDLAPDLGWIEVEGRKISLRAIDDLMMAPRLG